MGRDAVGKAGPGRGVLPRREALARLRLGTAPSLRHTFREASEATPPTVSTLRFGGGVLCPARGAVEGTELLPTVWLCLQARGRISPWTMAHSVSGLPSAFMVHAAGGLSLKIRVPGAGIPHGPSQGVLSKHERSPAQSQNLPGVQGSWDKLGSSEHCSAVREGPGGQGCWFELSLNCTPKRDWPHEGSHHQARETGSVFDWHTFSFHLMFSPRYQEASHLLKEQSMKSNVLGTHASQNWSGSSEVTCPPRAQRKPWLQRKSSTSLMTCQSSTDCQTRAVTQSFLLSWRKPSPRG